MRIKFGDYAAAFYVTGVLCVITSYFVLQISIKDKSQIWAKKAFTNEQVGKKPLMIWPHIFTHLLQ